MKIIITKEELKTLALKFPSLTVLEFINSIKG